MTPLLKTLFTILIMTLGLSLQTVQASEGFAVSGNFSSYHYKMVPGETISTPDVYVVFFNHYAVDIEVELSPHVTQLDGMPSVMGDRLEFIVESSLVTIPAKTHLTVPIGIKLAEDAPAGAYSVGLSAEVIPKAFGGITITGSAELRTQLTIFGEAGDVVLRTFDLFDEPLQATLTMYRVDGALLSPVKTSSNGLITDRVIPGAYFVVGTFKGDEVLEASFQVVENASTRLDLTAQTIFIEHMMVTPVLFESTGLLSRVRIHYTLRNIHTTVEDVRLVLVMHHGEAFLSRIEETTIPFFPETLFEHSFNTLPEDGWVPGTYTFHLEAYVGDFLLEDRVYIGQSREREFIVPAAYVAPPHTNDPNPADSLGLSAYLRWGAVGFSVLFFIGASILVIGLKRKT